MEALIVVPTYDESENIEKFIRTVLALEADLDILVVDDNSPDGTGDIVEPDDKIVAIGSGGAYALAAGPQFRPDQRQKVLDYLGRAEKDLSDTPGAGPLAAEAHGLIDKVDPPGRDIKMLLQDIQSQIDLQRQRAENHYWDAIGRTATE